MKYDGRGQWLDEDSGSGKGDEWLDRQLDALLAGLEIEQAPPSLTRRLYQIPLQEQSREGWWQKLLPRLYAPRWALVPALAAAILALGVVLMMPRQPSQEEILQARHDLAVAFGYIDRAGVLTGTEIRSILGEELRLPVKENLSRHIPFTEQFRKEEKT